MTNDTPNGVDAPEDAEPTGEANDQAEFQAAGDGTSGGGPDGVAADPVADALATVEAERDALKDQILRALAETENVRKRANRQVAEEKIYAVERFARDLLNVSDNLSRAFESLSEEARAALSDGGKTLLEGVELTQKELHAVMARHGVTAVDASPGADFDPNFHQAVTQVPSDQPAGKVAETFQSGWRIGDRTLRAAMVSVSLGGGTPSE